MAKLVMTGNGDELKALTLDGKLGQAPSKKEKRSGMKDKIERDESVSTDKSPDSRGKKEDPAGSNNKKNGNKPEPIR